MDQLNLNQPTGGPLGPPPLEKTGLNNPFFTDSKFGGQIRSFYFYRENFNTSLNEAWAIGGSL